MAGESQNPFEPPTHDGLETPDMRAEVVASLANKSVIFGAIGILCCGVVFGPLAIVYANRAETAMTVGDRGHSSAGTIKTGRILGYLAIGLWFVALLFRLGLLLVGERP